MKKHSSLPFTVDVPETWSDESTYVLADQTRNDFNSSLVVNSQVVMPNTTLEDYVNEQQETMKTHLAGFTVIEEAESTRVSGLEAMRMGYTYVTPDAHYVRQRQAYVMLKGRVYILTFTQLVDNFDAEADTFEEVLRSFQLRS
jgi:hypothetical protein